MVRNSRIISSLMLLLGVYVIVEARGFPKGTNGVLGPGFFPILLGVILILLAVLQLIFSVKQTDPPKADDVSVVAKRVLISGGIILGYIIGIKVLGFLISTPLFIFGIMTFFGVKKISTRVISSIATTAILYFIFLKFLSVSLPSGILF